MRLFRDDDVARFAWADVFDALRAAFHDPARYRSAERVHLDAPNGGAWLTMPCASDDGWFGVKQVGVLPANAAAGRPSVQAWYTLMGPDGAPVLATEAGLLTKLRTSAVSALAADVLAPAAVRSLLVVGTGALAPWMARAHLQVRPFETVWVWGRRRAGADATAVAIAATLDEAPRGRGGVRPTVALADDLEAAVRAADVVTVATTARAPLVAGAWLRADQHVDLVGAFLPTMREVDADAVRRAQVVVDERQAAEAEAGDLIQAAAEGWSWDAVAGDLADVLAGRVVRAGDRPTLFKSVGIALEDLAVARLLADGGGSVPA
jgi:ornithine cyclodeaminase/alanine dehydrogenase-like protein (mu-crystallin family)